MVSLHLASLTVVVRNRRGAVSVAEGCMFLAMALFAALLLALLVVAFFRFQEPPQQRPLQAPKRVPPAGSFQPPGDRPPRSTPAGLWLPTSPGRDRSLAAASP